MLDSECRALDVQGIWGRETPTNAIDQNAALSRNHPPSKDLATPAGLMTLALAGVILCISPPKVSLARSNRKQTRNRKIYARRRLIRLFAQSARSTASTIFVSSGATCDGQAPIAAPLRSSRYLWKFQRGAALAPSRSAIQR